MKKEDLKAILKSRMDEFSDSLTSSGNKWRYKYRLTDKDTTAVETASLQIYNQFVEKWNEGNPFYMKDELLNYFDNINPIIKVQTPKNLYREMTTNEKIEVVWDILTTIHNDDVDFISGIYTDDCIEWGTLQTASKLFF